MVLLYSSLQTSYVPGLMLASSIATRACPGFNSGMGTSSSSLSCVAGDPLVCRRQAVVVAGTEVMFSLIFQSDGAESQL